VTDAAVRGNVPEGPILMRVFDERSFGERLARGEVKCPAAALRLPLLPAGWLWGAAMRARRQAYRSGQRTARDAGVPVVSVGNLTAGGTGKTPMVEWVVRRLCALGRRPAVLSRGYGAARAGDCNDEALMLEGRLGGVRHYAAPDRVASGRRAVAAGADCLVLDDGFQHLRIRRAVNIVLLDALDPFGGGRVLPAGTLREPLSALADADALVLTRADAVTPEELAAIRARLAALAPGKPLVEAAHRPTELVDLDGGSALAAGALRGRRVAAVCGIGNPRGFVRTLESLGAEVVAAHFRPDHAPYALEDLALMVAFLGSDWKSGDAELIIVTEKDAVKLRRVCGEFLAAAGPMARRLPDAARAPQLKIADLPVRALRVDMALLSGEDRLDTLLKDALC
jgi:tetraacyldisaccharide 4'-kinase